MQNKVIITILSSFIVVISLLIYLTLSITPVELKRNVFTFEYGETIPTKVEDYVNGNESILKSVQLDLSQVSTEVGEYQAKMIYFDEVYTFEIHIVDTAKPKVKLKKVEFHIQIGETLKAENLIEEIEDHSQTTVYFYDEETKQLHKTKTFIEEGSFIERIVVEDAHGNQSSALRVKIVVEKNHVKPTITGADTTAIEIGSTFDPLFGVTAMDDLEGDITYKIRVSGVVDTSVAGEYVLTYSVSDKQGNTTKVTREVTVEE